MRTIQDEIALKKQLQKQRKEQSLNKGDGASIEKTMQYMRLEGGLFGVMTGLTQQFIPAFAMLFGASSFFVSVITTLPNLIGSIAQLTASKMVELFSSPRSYIVWFIGMQGVTWLILPLLQFIPDAPLTALLLVVIANATLGLMANPVWTSYMGDLIPEKKRTSYFSGRSSLLGASTFLGTIIAGWILGMTGKEFLGFTIIFILAFVMRATGVYLFSKAKNLPSHKSREEFSLQRFVDRMSNSDFGKFTKYIIWFRFAFFLSAPFFIVYQLNVLKISYTWFAILQAAPIVCMVLSMPYWRSVGERHGTRRLITLSTGVLGLVPLLWITTQSLPALVVFELLHGFGLAGLNLAIANYVLEATSPKSRTHAVSYFNLFQNLFIFLGGIVGSLLLTGMGWFVQNPYLPFLAIFFIGGLARIITWLIFREKLRELRFVEINVRKSGDTIALLPTGIVPLYDAGTTASSIPLTKHENPRDDYMKKLSKREREYFTKKFIERVKR